MCTAITYRNGDHYFGRNLDLHHGYKEEVVITPRNFPFRFRNGQSLLHHHSIIGMATVAMEYPLYYDATNESGLSMAGLNFPENAFYSPRVSGMDNIAPFELIAWVLGQCANVMEARILLRQTNVWMLPFSREFRLTPLHWLIADRESSLVVESTADGLRLWDNPAGVLTNSPSFPYQMMNLANYRHLQPADHKDSFCGIPVSPYSAGMGAIGLPGDYSSASRFVKAAYLRQNSRSDNNEQENVSQFFHLLSSVVMPRGAVKLPEGDEITLYSSCCNTDQGIYYYSTYENSRISAVHLHHADLEATHLTTFPLRKFSEIFMQN